VGGREITRKKGGEKGKREKSYSTRSFKVDESGYGGERTGATLLLDDDESERAGELDLVSSEGVSSLLECVEWVLRVRRR
jgi:hypothetical protein